MPPLPSEHELIARIRERAGDIASPAFAPWVALGIGDDAAALRPPRGELDVLTTDIQIEGVHFTRGARGLSMRAVGRKALAANLSDLAAMGASPRAATLSLALPADFQLPMLDELIDGFAELARLAHVPLVGGNLSGSLGPLVIDIALVGAAHERKLLTRSGGRPGHLLYVTGGLGRAAAARRLADQAHAGEDASAASLMDQHVAPAEQSAALLRSGMQVARARAAAAAIDVSDGLADAVGQLARASNTGARVDPDLVPIHALAQAVAGTTGHSANTGLDLALRGGEDYELLFAVPPRRRRLFEAIAGRHASVTCIGTLTGPADGVMLQGAAADSPSTPMGQGFSHFAHVDAD